MGLSSIALCWMLRRAREAGLPISDAKLEQFAARCNAGAEISKNFDPKLDPPRRVAQGDAVHETVQPRGHAGGREHNDPPAGVVVARG